MRSTGEGRRGKGVRRVEREVTLVGEGWDGSRRGVGQAAEDGG